jgi:hypothetical protein
MTAAMLTAAMLETSKTGGDQEPLFGDEKGG